MTETAADVVKAAYNLLLNREPEAAGLRHWSSALDGGLSRLEFVRAVVSSSEFRQTMASVEDLSQYGDVDLIFPVGRHQFRVPASDVSLVPHLLAHRCWEPHITYHLARTLRRSDVFMDVGANLGYFTVLCAPLVDRVIAFEPIPRNYAYCRGNIALNGLTNVDARCCGLWREDATVPFRNDTSSVMTASVAVDAPEADGLESIRVVSLDRQLASGALSLARLDLVKMDIEGSELSALHGMRETLRRFRPRLVMELNRPMLAACGASVDEVWEFLREMAYDIQAFDHWQERDPTPVGTLDELKRRCPPDSLLDIVAEPR